jgi:uncharacterized short protein YbdD (DUF466 family)
MQAEGIKAGDKSQTYDERGKVVSGWEATGDAVVTFSEEDGKDMVFVPVRHYDGGEGARVFEVGTNVPLSWGAGGDLQRTVKYPPGTPEYDAYVTELREELRKFRDHEPPYDNDELTRDRQNARSKP